MAARLSLVIAAHDPAMRDRLRGFLEGQQALRIAAECGSGERAVEIVREYRPSVLVIDCQMPDLSAREIVEAIGVEETPSVLFVTRMDRALLQAFEVHGVPYLLRPLSKKRFRDALRRAALRTEPRALSGVRRRLARMLAADEEGSRERRIAIRSKGKPQYVDLDDVRWVEGAGAFSRLHLDEGTHIVKATLDELAHRFPDGFLRIHSTLVRTSEVAEIQSAEDGGALVTLRDGRHLRVSESAPPEVVQAG